MRFALYLVALTLLLVQPTQADEVLIETDPSRAGIWQPEKRSLRFLGTTPLTRNFSFRSTNDAKRLHLKRLGFKSQEIILKQGVKSLSLRLERVNLFRDSGRAETRLPASLKNRIEQVVYGSRTDPLAGLRLTLRGIGLVGTGTPTLGLFVEGEKDLGGRELRAAYRKRTSDEQRVKIANVLLEAGLDKVLDFGNTLVAQSDIENIVVVISFETSSRAFKETEQVVNRNRTFKSGYVLYQSSWQELHRFSELDNVAKRQTLYFASPVRNNATGAGAYQVSDMSDDGSIWVEPTGG